VLGEVKALRFGSFVRPGEALEVEVTLEKTLDRGEFACRGSGRVRRAGADAAETAVSGRFIMRPLRTGLREEGAVAREQAPVAATST
jgi:hypothetical protein